MAAWTKEGHFDDRVFQAFVKSIGIYPTGSLVKLQSGRLAVVVEQGSGLAALAHRARVFLDQVQPAHPGRAARPGQDRGPDRLA